MAPMANFDPFMIFGLLFSDMESVRLPPTAIETEFLIGFRLIVEGNFKQG
jgi:hypothetical protein